jgi:hypothetical protein
MTSRVTTLTPHRSIPSERGLPLLISCLFSRILPKGTAGASVASSQQKEGFLNLDPTVEPLTRVLEVLRPLLLAFRFTRGMVR